MNTYISSQYGHGISEIEHVAQSITDILTTRIGTRVKRREYGSALPDLVDNPMNGSTMVELYMAVADALDRWEPRVMVTNVAFTSEEPENGTLIMDVRGIYVPTGGTINLEGIELRL